MLKSLKYNVEFPTGKKLSADLTFQMGLTAVSGANEAGKSMVLEMIRFGLFGSAALRGKASDYKKLSMEMVFVVRGSEYTITRTTTKAELTNSDGPVASGTRPVNDHVRSVFGYDMTVFDTANNCAQGEIERLGSMKPTERKALVDQTVGLNAVDDLIKEVGEEASGERRAYEAINSVLVEPEPPTQPDNYCGAGNVKSLINEYRSLMSELTTTRGWLVSAASRTEPSSPGPAPSGKSVKELQDHERQREEVERLRHQLQVQLGQIPQVTMTREEIDEARSLMEHNSRVSQRRRLEERFPVSPIGTDVIEAADKAHSAKQLTTEIERLEKSGTVTCPACSADFPHEHKTIASLTQDLMSLQPYDLTLAEKYSRRDLDRYMSMIEERAKFQEEIDNLPDEPVLVTIDVGTLDVAEYALNQQSTRASVEKSLADLPALPDLRPELHQMVSWETAQARYESEQRSWEAFCAEKDQKQAYCDDLNNKVSAEALAKLEAQHQTELLYEASLNSYEQANRRYLTNKLVADQHKERMEDLDKARKALRELKVRIKGYLLPSLNKVASSLLSQMTGGERNLVQIDEDFEILIDGQPLATLSGSGKAVANLAIRLGLGQVLTNKVFSVFMADEIDAAMDDNRAGYTAECLSRLTSSIGQVVLVSHKTVNATHHIVLGTTNEESESVQRRDGADCE